MNLPNWLSFLLLTLVISIPLYVSLLRFKLTDEDKTGLERAVRQMMWAPGIAAFAIISYKQLGFEFINFGPGKFPLLLIGALLLPIAMEFLLIFAAIRFNLGRIDGGIFGIKDGWIYLSPSVRLVFGHDKQTTFKFIMNLISTVGVAAAFSLVFSLSEEFGWRGFLQNLIIDRFTLTWGLVLSGLAWGFWYAPAVLRGYRFPDYPKLGAFVFMPVYTVSAGIVIGWLYWLSGSIWVPAIFNASLKVTSIISEVALGEAGKSRRVRIVWLWLWAVLAGLSLTIWYAGL